MSRYSDLQLGAIAAHMLGDLAATRAPERTSRIGAWTETLDPDQQDQMLAMALEGLLGFVDALAQLTPGHRALLDQALARGVDSTGPLPERFEAPNRAPEI